MQTLGTEETRAIAALTGCACDTVTVCPVLPGSAYVSSYVLSAGGECMSWIDRYSAMGNAIAALLTKTNEATP